jgi:hypothetical protein
VAPTTLALGVVWNPGIAEDPWPVFVDYATAYYARTGGGHQWMVVEFVDGDEDELGVCITATDPYRRENYRVWLKFVADGGLPAVLVLEVEKT